MLMPAFYAAHAGVSLAALGAATALARVLDAVVDPVIGHLSDHTRTRFGPRVPWIAGGTLLLCVAAWQIFRPPATADIGWYLFWSSIVYLAVALLDTPMRAWGSELSRSPSVRARLFTYIGLARVTGSLAFLAMAPLAWALAGITDLADPRTLAIASVVLVLSMPLLVGVCLSSTPIVRPETDQVERPSLRAFWRDAGSNKPLRCYVGAYGCWSASSGASTAVTFIVLADYLRLGGVLTALLAVFFVAQLAAMPLWPWLLRRVEKHRLLAIVWAADAVLKPMLLAFTPGEPAGPALWLLITAMAVTGSISYSIPQAVLAEIVDFDSLRSRTSRPASFFALGTVLYKVAFGLGGSLALLVLGSLGYRMGSTHGAGMPISLWASAIVLPGLLLLAASALIWNLRLDTRRHGIVLRRLARRNERQMAMPPALAPATSGS